MLYGNSCTNPIIYSVCNDQFRTAFKDLFGSCLRACCLFVKFARISKNRETAYSLRENRDARSPVHGNTFTAKEAETQKNYENIETRSKDFPAESSNNKGTTILLPQSCKHEVMSLVTAVWRRAEWKEWEHARLHDTKIFTRYIVLKIFVVYLHGAGVPGEWVTPGDEWPPRDEWPLGMSDLQGWVTPSVSYPRVKLLSSRDEWPLSLISIGMSDPQGMCASKGWVIPRDEWPPVTQL